MHAAKGNRRSRLHATLCLLLLAFGCGPGEPQYEGKRASHWLEDMKHPDAARRWRAAHALGRIGPGAPKGTIPALTEALEDKDQLVRWSAATALQSFGPQAAMAAPALRLMKEKDEFDMARQAAAAALKSIEGG
jgi:HEAT repeat protein